MGNTSHVVVNYSPELLEDILVNSQNLTHIDKLQLLQDLRLLADSCLTSYSKVIPLLKEFSNSDSAIVNETLYSIVNNLKFFVTPDSTDETNLKKFVNTLSADQVQRLSWLPKDIDSNDDQLVRPLVLNAALYAENPSAKSEAHEIFTQNQDKLLSLSSDIRPLVLQNEVKNYNSSQLFESLLEDYRKTSDSSYKQDILFALTSTKDADQIQQIVSYFEDADTIKPQDLRTWYFRTLSNNLGEQAAWDWIRNEWQWLEDRVGGDMEFTSYITVTARALHTESRLVEFKKFFEPKLNTPGLTREIIMDTKVIESRVAMIERERDHVNAAISNILD